jgi:hypothetical protein
MQVIVYLSSAMRMGEDLFPNPLAVVRSEDLNPLLSTLPSATSSLKDLHVSKIK